jgi:hypothetical protein
METTSLQSPDDLIGRLARFARTGCGITLRPYQLEAAGAVLESIRGRAGRSIVIMLSRQSGKDELSANLKAYLLSRLYKREAGIVEVNPTYKPQTINAILRLEERLRVNPHTRDFWRKRSDFMRLLGRARVTFLSGDAKANVVGAVASTLLIVNEAQDIEPAVYDRNFAPMAASTNATRLFMGTAWTSHTLLGRELRAARKAEQVDGVRRVFLYDADDVRAALPEYGAHVDGEIARLGRGHPLIKTQYFNEEIDAQGSMFNAARRALMGCAGPRPRLPVDGETSQGEANVFVFSIDVAGQDEATFHDPEEQLLRNPGRDAVSLTIARVDLSALETLQAPIFRVVRREQWTGLNHLDVFARIRTLADMLRPQHIVIDATGVGEGLWAMLDKRYPGRVRPVKFSAQVKSELGYRFLAMIETGRFQDCSHVQRFSPTNEPLPGPEISFSSTVSAETVDAQYAACASEVLTGPQKLMRWGVPEGRRDADGALIHDDLVMADALLAEVDGLDWSLPGKTVIIAPKDPLEEMSHFR